MHSTLSFRLFQLEAVTHLQHDGYDYGGLKGFSKEDEHGDDAEDVRHVAPATALGWLRMF